MSKAYIRPWFSSVVVTLLVTTAGAGRALSNDDAYAKAEAKPQARVVKVIALGEYEDLTEVGMANLSVNGTTLSTFVAAVSQRANPMWMLKIDAEGLATGPFKDSQLNPLAVATSAEGILYVLGNDGIGSVVKAYTAEGFQLEERTRRFSRLSVAKDAPAPLQRLLFDEVAREPVRAIMVGNCLELDAAGGPRKPLCVEVAKGSTLSLRDVLAANGRVVAIGDLYEPHWVTRPRTPEEANAVRAQIAQEDATIAPLQGEVTAIEKDLEQTKKNPGLKNNAEYAEDHAARLKSTQRRLDDKRAELKAKTAGRDALSAKLAEPYTYVAELEHAVWIGIIDSALSRVEHAFVQPREVEQGKELTTGSALAAHVQGKTATLRQVQAFAQDKKIILAGFLGRNSREVYNAIINLEVPGSAIEREIELSGNVLSPKVLATGQGLFIAGYSRHRGEAEVTWIRPDGSVAGPLTFPNIALSGVRGATTLGDHTLLLIGNNAHHIMLSTIPLSLF